MSELFKGKVVIVTGAGGAIGRAAAIGFAAEQARVVVSDLNIDSTAETAELISKNGGEVYAVTGDVSDSAYVAELVAKTVRHFGGLDCAFNNAGITHPDDSTWDEDAYRRIIEVNVFSQMYCMKHQIPEMIKRGKGAIVNTSSVLGLLGQAEPVMPGYASSKHAVIGLTKSAALQYVKAGIRVNAVCPGITRSKMIDEFMEMGGTIRERLSNYAPIGRIAEPTEIAEAAIWLCSDKASYVTGHALIVDGGFSAQ